MKNPKNVEAVLDWYETHRPDMLPTIASLFSLGKDPSNRTAEGMVGLLLQGFEAGREFEHKHPEIESGIGYLND